MARHERQLWPTHLNLRCTSSQYHLSESSAPIKSRGKDARFARGGESRYETENFPGAQDEFSNIFSSATSKHLVPTVQDEANNAVYWEHLHLV